MSAAADDVSRPRALPGAGRVRVVGTGLLGTSVGLALADLGVEAELEDRSPDAVLLARLLGAGRPAADGDPDLVIVATPPDVTAQVVAQQLQRHPAATVTDLASVKQPIHLQLAGLGATLERYVGGHPMAGSERSGPLAARADLFRGRSWVICPEADTHARRVEQVRLLAHALGAAPVVMSALEHDHAVAAVSHLPHLASGLVAARLREAEQSALRLCGQGVRDVTRIAAGDPDLWVQIISANARAVSPLLHALRDDLDRLIGAVDGAASTPDTPSQSSAARESLHAALTAGNRGRARVPGGDPSPAAGQELLTVLVTDTPGTLRDLFGAVAECGVNVESFDLDPLPDSGHGLLTLTVPRASREPLADRLCGRGWRVDRTPDTVPPVPART